MYTWPVDRTCLPDIDPDDAPEDVLRLEAAIDTAVTVLWALTGRTYAIEHVVARPCPARQDAADVAMFGVGFTPLLVDGGWLNVTGCGGSTCTADGRGVVRLPGPVVAITAVYVDGVAIDPSGYTLAGDTLYRTAGEWPDQDMDLPPGEAGTWSVSYTRGVPPPYGAALAVGQLAKEFWAVCSGGKCRLPKRWQSITRQGVSIQRADPTDILAQGYTGLPEVDTWVRAINPHKLSQPSVIASPDFSSVVPR